MYPITCMPGKINVLVVSLAANAVLVHCKENPSGALTFVILRGISLFAVSMFKSVELFNFQ